MSFEPIIWVNDETLITPARLRHMETQYEKALQEASEPMRTDTAVTLKAEILSAEPAGTAGRIHFNTSTGQLWGFTDAWQEVGE